jgi:hypothetical protein
MTEREADLVWTQLRQARSWPEETPSEEFPEDRPHPLSDSPGSGVMPRRKQKATQKTQAEKKGYPESKRRLKKSWKRKPRPV